MSALAKISTLTTDFTNVYSPSKYENSIYTWLENVLACMVFLSICSTTTPVWDFYTPNIALYRDMFEYNCS